MVKIIDLKNKQETPKPKSLWRTTAKKNKSKFFIVLVLFFILFNSINLFSEAKYFVFNFKDSLSTAFQSINQAKLSTQKANFTEAEEAFLAANEILAQITKDSWFLASSNSSVSSIFEAATLISDAGQILIQQANTLKTLPENFLAANADFINNSPESRAEKVNLTFPLAQVQSNIKVSYQKLKQASLILKKVPIAILPSSVQSQFKATLDQLATLEQLMDTLVSYLDVSLDLLGHQVPHTYLILIQNNFESRPTGGFFGSMVFAEVDNGVLTQFELKDIYDFDGILLDNPDYLPPEYEGFNQKLWIRDANYTPDFKVSALRIESLLQKANAPSFDTILSIDQTFIENLLAQTGPVALEGYDAKISADNYFTVLTYLIEANKDQNSEDKTILRKFIDGFQQQIFAKSSWKLIVPVFADGLANKHIQIASKKDFIQELSEKFLFANRFNFSNQSNTNNLLVTNTSIGGNKTDKFIKQRFILNTHFKANHSVQNSLTIRRHHSFTDNQELLWQAMLRPFNINSMVDYTRFILGRGDNVSVLKVYVPNNSKLISVDGQIQVSDVQIHTDPDLNQQYFLFKMSTKPMQTSEVTIVYQPPIKLKPKPLDNYNLNLLSQAGQINTIFQKTYSFENPEEQSIQAHFPEFTGSLHNLEFNFEQNKLLKSVYVQLD